MIDSLVRSAAAGAFVILAGCSSLLAPQPDLSKFFVLSAAAASARAATAAEFGSVVKTSRLRRATEQFARRIGIPEIAASWPHAPVLRSRRMRKSPRRCALFAITSMDFAAERTRWRRGGDLNPRSHEGTRDFESRRLNQTPEPLRNR